ncbi:MATE family efflux transporter [Spirochaeta cellobiosiphila]|uniref:MATE family efflux transporter n=1 Tax=Spirochaeta cellobiosiphila TaxID=504483 RepID=UPI0004162205|nr:MATE family efflux transporter [Spirochaeta cellobiosiphila]
MPSQNNNKRMEMMASGAIGSALFKLSTPAIIGMLVMAIYNVVDTFFVSLMRDTAAVAATGIVFPIFQLIGSIGLTLGIGAASVISRRLGEQEHKKAEQTAATAVYTAIGVGLVFAILGAIFIRPLLGLFGASPAIMDVASLYGRIIVGGSIFQVFNMCINNILRSEGASLHSSMGQIIGAVLNIILDPIFIFVLNMGITGAAVATILSQAMASLFLASYYLRKKGELHPFTLSNFHPTKESYSQIMVLGTPTLARQFLGSISFASVNNMAGLFGDSAIAAVSISLRLFSIVMMALMGLAQGAQPLTGYNYGAKQYTRVHGVIRLVFLTATIVGLVAGVTSFFFARTIMEIFSPQNQEVVRLGITSIRMMAVTLVPIGLVIMYGGIFQALGNGKYALILATGQQGLFMIPLVLILPHIMGVNGVFAAQPLGFFLAFLVGTVLYIKQRNTLHKIEALSN